jgi:hypothetical protein
VALDQRALDRQRALVERIDEGAGDDVETRPIRPDVGMHARPLYVAVSVVDTMTSGTAHLP